MQPASKTSGKPQFPFAAADKPARTNLSGQNLVLKVHQA